MGDWKSRGFEFMKIKQMSSGAGIEGVGGKFLYLSIAMNKFHEQS